MPTGLLIFMVTGKDRPGEMVKYSLLYDNTQTNHFIQRNIVLVSDGNYSIQNYGYRSYDTLLRRGHNIVGGDHQQQWKIIDLEEHGNSYVCVYVCDYDHFFILICECRICPTKNKCVYWRWGKLYSAHN